MASKTGVVVLLSDAMIEALDGEAKKQKVSRSELVRAAVADFIAYDLDAEPATVKRSKYATKEERDAEMRRRAKERRDVTRAVVNAMRAGADEETLRKIAAPLIKKA